MESDDLQERQRRGSCLTIMLTGGLVGFFLLLLVVATGGWAVHVLWIGTAIFLFGAIHYLLWGRLMLHQTAREREEEDVRRRAEEREGRESEAGSNRIRRLP
jgi:phosphotransferase system  glucose/maltose/N-acetylglucosamine-specific IIC component